MTKWRYIEPGDNNEPVVHELTEAEILATYGPYWREQMQRVGKRPEDYSDQDIIDDFVVVHWAERVE